MHVVLPARSLALPKPSPPVPSRWLVLVVALAGLGKVAALFNLSQAMPALGFVEALRIASSGETADRAGFVVQELRLPPVVGALLLGAMFGLAGTIMQDTLRNPMAGPEFLGVASGASLFVAFVALFPVGLAPVWHPLLALVAGVLCAWAILGMTHRATDPVRVLLTGGVFTTLLGVPFFLRLLVRSR